MCREPARSSCALPVRSGLKTSGWEQICASQGKFRQTAQMSNVCTSTQKCYPEWSKAAAALSWRQIRAALPLCHQHAVIIQTPCYIPEDPAPDMWLKQPSSMRSTGWRQEVLHLDLSMGAYVARAISSFFLWERERWGKLLHLSPCSCPFMPLKCPVVPAQTPPIPQWEPKLLFCQGQWQAPKSVLNVIFHLALEDHDEMQICPVHITCPFSTFCTVYALNIFSNSLGETLYWIHESEIISKDKSWG